MLKINNSWLGVALGLILPGITFFFTEILKTDMHVMGKENVFYILSVLANLIAARYYFKLDKDSTAFGLLGSTFLCAFIFLFFKVRQ